MNKNVKDEKMRTDIEEKIDKILYEIGDFFSDGERRKAVYRYDDHRILAEIIRRKLGFLFEDISREIKTEVAGIGGILNGSAVNDTGQCHIAEMKLGKILTILGSLEVKKW